MRAALDATAQEARTDELTGLPNRRALLEELESRTQRDRELHADARRPQRLQALQRHLRPSRRRCAAETTRPQARCGVRRRRDRGPARRRRVLCPAPRERVSRRGTRAGAGRAQRRGRGLSASRPRRGSSRVPAEAHDPSSALRLADSRMYAAKVSAHPSPEAGMSAALKRGCSTSATRASAASSRRSRAWLWPARSRSASPPTTSSWSNAPRSCTTSARSASPPRSSPSTGGSATRRSRSCAGTASSASASSPVSPRWSARPQWCAPRTSAGTAMAIQTVWPETRFRSRPGSSSSPTRTAR